MLHMLEQNITRHRAKYTRSHSESHAIVNSLHARDPPAAPLHTTRVLMQARETPDLRQCLDEISPLICERAARLVSRAARRSSLQDRSRELAELLPRRRFGRFVADH